MKEQINITYILDLNKNLNRVLFSLVYQSSNLSHKFFGEIKLYFRNSDDSTDFKISVLRKSANALPFLH